MPLPSLAAIAVREGTFQQGGWKTPPPPAMLDQKKPGRIRVKLILLMSIYLPDLLHPPQSMHVIRKVVGMRTF